MPEDASLAGKNVEGEYGFSCVSPNRYRIQASINAVQYLTRILSTAALEAALFLAALQTRMAWDSGHLASFSAALVLVFLMGSVYHRVRPLPRGRSGISILDIVIFRCVLFLRGGFPAATVGVSWP